MDGQENNMNGSWFFDKNFNGVPDDFFDDALKYLDLPMEDVESNDAIEDWESQFQQLPTPSNLLSDFSFGISHHISKDSLKLKSSSVLSAESSQPKPWLAAAEASSGRRITLGYHASDSKCPHPFRTTSPVSVLESSSSTSSAENSTVYQPKFAIPVKRPRSKCTRPRRHTFTFIATLHAPNHHLWVDSAQSDPDEKTLNLGNKKLKKKNLMMLSCNVERKKPFEVPGQIRKCTHCEVTKTPQWREGPMGPKTLCNACGVRYRSGRLFPEYRPAASPTFTPTLHSNSHRKVVEMRKNHRHVGTMAAMNTALSPVPEYSF